MGEQLAMPPSPNGNNNGRGQLPEINVDPQLDPNLVDNFVAGLDPNGSQSPPEPNVPNESVGENTGHQDQTETAANQPEDSPGANTPANANRGRFGGRNRQIFPYSPEDPRYNARPTEADDEARPRGNKPVDFSRFDREGFSAIRDEGPAEITHAGTGEKMSIDDVKARTGEATSQVARDLAQTPDAFSSRVENTPDGPVSVETAVLAEGLKFEAVIDQQGRLKDAHIEITNKSGDGRQVESAGTVDIVNPSPSPDSAEKTDILVNGEPAGAADAESVERVVAEIQSDQKQKSEQVREPNGADSEQRNSSDPDSKQESEPSKEQPTQKPAATESQKEKDTSHESGKTRTRQEQAQEKREKGFKHALRAYGQAIGRERLKGLVEESLTETLPKGQKPTEEQVREAIRGLRMTKESSDAMRRLVREGAKPDSSLWQENPNPNKRNGGRSLANAAKESQDLLKDVIKKSLPEKL